MGHGAPEGGLGPCLGRENRCCGRGAADCTSLTPPPSWGVHIRRGKGPWGQGSGLRPVQCSQFSRGRRSNVPAAGGSRGSRPGLRVLAVPRQAWEPTRPWETQQPHPCPWAGQPGDHGCPGHATGHPQEQGAPGLLPRLFSTTASGHGRVVGASRSAEQRGPRDRSACAFQRPGLDCGRAWPSESVQPPCEPPVGRARRSASDSNESEPLRFVTAGRPRAAGPRSAHRLPWPRPHCASPGFSPLSEAKAVTGEAPVSPTCMWGTETAQGAVWVAQRLLKRPAAPSAPELARAASQGPAGLDSRTAEVCLRGGGQGLSCLRPNCPLGWKDQGCSWGLASCSTQSCANPHMSAGCPPDSGLCWTLERPNNEAGLYLKR